MNNEENNVGKRPWGHYQNLSVSDLFKVKKIVVQAKQRLSYQRHFKRDEHWYIVSGEADVTIDGEIQHLKKGDCIDIFALQWHRIHNTEEKELVFIEIQTGEYFGEDDIERSQDDYGRT